VNTLEQTKIKPTLSYLNRLTDNFGTWQHATEHDILVEEGYALDDSARALIVFLQYGNKEKALVCLNYLRESLKDGQFVGFFSPDKKVLVYPSSRDAHALGIWAIAHAHKAKLNEELTTQMLKELENSWDDSYLRTSAYNLLAAAQLEDTARITKFKKIILDSFNHDWEWFEERLIYANAIFLYSLLMSGEDTNSDVIQKSLRTLEKFTHIGAFPAPVGNRLWQELNDERRDIYGQQPIDAGFTVLMYAKLFELTKDNSYREKAQKWMSWFYGNNIWQQSLVRESDSSCGDGLDVHGVNQHRGSESTIIYLWAAKVFTDIL